MNLSAPVEATLTAPPVRIAIILGLAVLVTLVLRLLVSQLVRRLDRLPAPSLKVGSTTRVTVGSTNPRRHQRLNTFRSVINSTVGIVVGSVAILMVLGELGLDVRPLLASAGVVGVALAFGAQSLVRDIISGLFMLMEDQYGVGDRVELGTAGGVMATGTIEEVALRVTTVRDDDGRLCYVRNGEILRVANSSQGWSLAVVEVRVHSGTDLMAVRRVLTEITESLRADERFAAGIGDAEPEGRVENLSATGMTLRWSVRTSAGQQWAVASELRRLVAIRFPDEGIELAD